MTAAVALMMAATAAAAPARDYEGERLRMALVGTWENASANLPPGLRQVKHVTPTHYTWVMYDTASMAPVSMAGGTWTVENGRFKQKCDYAGPGAEHERGTELVFMARVDAGKWSHAGILPNGVKVYELWTRVPAEARK